MDEGRRAGRRLLGFSIAGAGCFFLAAAFAFAARWEPSLPLGRYRLQLLDRDCAGLALVSALAGVSLLVSMAIAVGRWQKHRRATSTGRWLALAAVAFLAIFGIALAAWPSPPIRLTLLPAEPSGLVGHRVWVRGFKPGPYPLAADGAPILVEAAGRPGLPLTCAIERSVELGPFGWARFVSPAAGGEVGRRREAVTDPPDSCRPGIDLSQVTTDRRAQKLLAPFVLKNRVAIDGSDVDAAEGRPDRADLPPTAIGRYLAFQRSPEQAARASPGSIDPARDALQRRGSRYGSFDHVLATYRCDAAYAAFLEARGARVPDDLRELASTVARGGVDAGALGLRDESAWSMRLGPIESLQGGDRRVAISKPLADPACVELFAFYRKLPP